MARHYEADRAQQLALDEFFAYDDEENRARTGAVIMALTEYAARAVDRAGHAQEKLKAQATR